MLSSHFGDGRKQKGMKKPTVFLFFLSPDTFGTNGLRQAWQIYKLCYSNVITCHGILHLTFIEVVFLEMEQKIAAAHKKSQPFTEKYN